MCKAKSEGGFRCSAEAEKVRAKLTPKLERQLSPATAYALSTPLASVLYPEANSLLEKIAKNEVLSSAPSEKDLRKAHKSKESFLAAGDRERFEAMEEAYSAARSHREAVAVRSILEEYIGRYRTGERLGLREQVKVGAITIVSPEQAFSQYKTKTVAENALAQANMFIEGTAAAQKALETEKAKAKAVFRALVERERSRILGPYVSSAMAT